MLQKSGFKISSVKCLFFKLGRAVLTTESFELSTNGDSRALILALAVSKLFLEVESSLSPTQTMTLLLRGVPALPSVRSNFYLVRPHVCSISTSSDLPLSSSSSLSPKPLRPALRDRIFYRAPYASLRHPFSSPPTPRAAPGDVLQDAGATAAVLAGAYAFVFSFEYLARRKLIQQNLSRKLVHVFSGLLFMVSWPIFRYPFALYLISLQDSTSTEARYFASLVPLVNCLRLVIHGLSLASDEGLIKSVTREGKPEELLRGPLYYVLVLILCALVFWRESPVGVISLAMMCGGDGVADIIGRRFGSIKLPYNQHKSWAGSISMFIFGFLISIGCASNHHRGYINGMLYYYSIFGYFQLDWAWTVRKVALVSLVATVVESLSTTDVIDDNISVPLVSMAAAFVSFGY
ncbi:putative phytol kinase 1, chloroplastic [Morella rubra]|uniref:phytol kinase n=1 Tax=Morella rubra TaxID=262757 RepID=A0A6A1WKJ5_9ROSI|nr:putative phytol kinase 1, chloroplastic [Morella rubra]